MKSTPPRVAQAGSEVLFTPVIGSNWGVRSALGPPHAPSSLPPPAGTLPIMRPRTLPSLVAAVAALSLVGCAQIRTVNGGSITGGTPDDRSAAIAMFTTIRVAPGVDRPLTLIAPELGRLAPLLNPDLKAGPPAIVFLHGRGECGDDGVRSIAVGLPAAAIADPARWPFLILVPQKPGFDETWESHEQYVLACIEWLIQAGGADRSRVYLTGLSQGGAGTWAIAARHPGLFAAIAPVCGFAHREAPRASGVGFGDDAQRADIARRLADARMPIWAFHGEKDDVVPPAHTRMMMQAIESAGGGDLAKVTYFDDANHNAWDPAYRDHGAELAAWLLSHRRE